MQGRHGGAHIGVVLLRGGIHGSPVRERRSGPQVIGKSVAGARIGKQQNPQLQSRVVGQQLRVLGVPLALLVLQLGFQNISVGHDPALLQLLCQAHKILRFGRGTLGDPQLLLIRKQAIVLLHNREDQPAPGDFRERCRLGRGGIGALELRDSGEAQAFPIRRPGLRTREWRCWR